MTAKECFGIVIRTLGLLSLFASALYLYSTVVALFVRDAQRAYGPASYFGFFILTSIVGLYFLRGAPLLMRFAYPAVGSPTQGSGGADGS